MSKGQSYEWFSSFTGKIINLDNLSSEVICIEDIAHALSGIARWGGHSRDFFSVAEHSTRMVECFLQDWKIQGEEKRMWGLAKDLLLHDAAEAYIGDMISPLKRRIRDGDALSGYDKIETGMFIAIACRFGLETAYQRTGNVKLYDMRALHRESLDLLADNDALVAWRKHLPTPLPRKIFTPLTPKEAEMTFLKVWHDICDGLR